MMQFSLINKCLITSRKQKDYSFSHSNSFICEYGKILKLNRLCLFASVYSVKVNNTVTKPYLINVF